MQHLVIPTDDAADDWYVAFQFKIVMIGTKWKPPRIIASMTREQADELRKNPQIKYVSCNEPISDEQISEKILELYRENTSVGTKAADSLLDLMVRLKELEALRP